VLFRSLVVFALFAAGWAVNLPPLVRLYGDDYWGVGPRVAREVRARGIHRAVVFTPGNFGEVFAENSPFLDGDVVYARDRGEENALLLAQLPGRAAYVIGPRR
jgi:hypothetical protein